MRYLLVNPNGIMVGAGSFDCIKAELIKANERRPWYWTEYEMVQDTPEVREVLAAIEGH